jgi:hypothetical protein
LFDPLAHSGETYTVVPLDPGTLDKVWPRYATGTDRNSNIKPNALAKSMSLSCVAFAIGGQLAVTPCWAAFDRAIATRGWLRCKFKAIIASVRSQR